MNDISATMHGMDHRPRTHTVGNLVLNFFLILAAVLCLAWAPRSPSQEALSLE